MLLNEYTCHHCLSLSAPSLSVVMIFQVYTFSFQFQDLIDLNKMLLSLRHQVIISAESLFSSFRYLVLSSCWMMKLCHMRFVTVGWYWAHRAARIQLPLSTANIIHTHVTTGAPLCLSCCNVCIWALCFKVHTSLLLKINVHTKHVWKVRITADDHCSTLVMTSLCWTKTSIASLFIYLLLQMNYVSLRFNSS